MYRGHAMGGLCSSQTGKTTPAAAIVQPVITEEKKPQSPLPSAARVATPRPLTKAGSRDDGNNEEHSIMRLLLLGAAESGKTTLLEQIRLLYNQNYSEAELFHRKVFIYNSVLIGMQQLIRHVMQTPHEFSSDQISEYAQFILLEEQKNSRFTDEQRKAILSVWEDPAIKEAYKERSVFNLNDSISYFLADLDRIDAIDYQPTPADLIMSYVPTIGVQNVIFTANKRTFQLFDIGGQRIDRRKWATMYDGIDAIFFCLAISEYNQTMYEDSSTNRLEDSMNLLAKISAEPKFASTPIFLFLNEIDVFNQKLPLYPLQNYIPEYKGSSPDDAISFLEQMARQRASSHVSSLLFVYRTVMIDTPKISKILADIFKKQLK